MTIMPAKFNGIVSHTFDSH
jgi:hypothetical protein